MPAGKSLIGFILCAACASLSAAAFADGAPLTLTPENTVIVYANGYGAAELQYVLMRAVARAPDAEKYAPGAKIDRSAAADFPMYDASRIKPLPKDKNIIAFVRASYLDKADADRVSGTPGAVLLKRQGNMVVIASDNPADPRTSGFAAAGAFLSHVAGVRMYAPDELWWSMPAKSQIVVGDLDLFIKPVLASATWGGAWLHGYPRQWDALNTSVTEDIPLRATHAIDTYFNPDKYYKTNPGIYPMLANGTRPKPSGTAWNPCLTAPELPEIAMREIRQRMKERPNTPYLSFGVMDSPFDSHDPATQASVRAHGGSYSNLYYTFLNKVAVQVAKEFPRLYLTSYAYANVSEPPVDMRIEPNIVVDIVVKSYNWVDPAAAKAEQGEIKAWSDLGASWVAHDWSFSGVSPREYTRTYAKFLQWTIRNGMKAVYTEWSPMAAWSLDGPRYWIMRQLQTDPNLDVDALWKQYCDDMYGPASKSMYALFKTFTDKYAESDDHITRNDAPRQEMALYTPADLAHQRQLLEEAGRQAAEDPLVQKRLKEFERYYRANALFAKAVGEPLRLYNQHKEGGINKKALAFYAADDASHLRKAIDYYQSVYPEGSQPTARTLGMFASYVNDYSLALGQTLEAISRQAAAGMDMNHPTPGSVAAYKARADKILHDNLPANAPQGDHLQQMLDQVLWLPEGKSMPAIDGQPDDPSWKDAAPLENFTVAGLFQPAGENPTSGRIMRVGDQLLISMTCRQNGPIWASTPADVKTGTRIWRESGIEVFFGPPASEDDPKPPYAHYVINTLGAYRGFSASADQRDGVRVAVARRGDEYTIEASLPLKAAHYDYSGLPVLSFNVLRNVYTRDSYTADEVIGWHPVYASGTYPQSRGLLFTRPGK